MKRIVADARRDGAAERRALRDAECQPHNVEVLLPRTLTLFQQVYGEMTSEQRQRFTRLAMEYRALKAEMLLLRDQSIEPFGLQSCLSPANFPDSIPWGDEEDE
jgi:hypothetical protein